MPVNCPPAIPSKPRRKEPCSMSRAPFSLSPDLKRLRDEGYFVQIVGGFLVMHEVPYVDASRRVRRASLVSTLRLAADVAQAPRPHTVHWTGDYPCNADGSLIAQISHQSQLTDLGHGLIAKHGFSSKPPGGYRDYHDKMTTYASVIAGPAAALQPGVSAMTFITPDGEDGSMFNYTETASDRVGIGALTQRLEGERVAIIGLGGSGSYVLDFIAKTPVSEIRLFDQDSFLQHNAFRAPGAPSLEALREAPYKVEYLADIYSRMHRGITAHATKLDGSNLQLLDGVTFAFICMDAGKPKQAIIEKLVAMDAGFIDVGMGLQLNEGALGGLLRVTASMPGMRGSMARVPLEGGGEDDLYATNIQVADLNALNAAFAVIKWKKLRGFYCDLEQELHFLYATDGNLLVNEERPHAKAA
ncbi:MAG: ThiF family adenylyltransferase [Sphingomicrobium sp.]